MVKIKVNRKGYKRRAYIRKDGVRVKEATVGPSSYFIEDKGKPGRTPEKEKWFEPGVETGWEKEQPESVRRAKVLKAHKGDILASARAMQALSNVSTDRQTIRAAGRDARFFFREHRKNSRVAMGHRRQLRITPKRPKLER